MQRGRRWIQRLAWTITGLVVIGGITPRVCSTGATESVFPLAEDVSFEQFLRSLEKAERRFSKIEFVTEEHYVSLREPIVPGELKEQTITTHHIYQDDWFRVHSYDSGTKFDGEPVTGDLLRVYDGDRSMGLRNGKVANLFPGKNRHPFSVNPYKKLARVSSGLDKTLAQHLRDPYGKTGWKLHTAFRGVVERNDRNLFLVSIGTYDVQNPEPLSAEVYPPQVSRDKDLYFRRDVYFEATEDMWPVRYEAVTIEGDIGSGEFLRQTGVVSEWQYVDGKRLPATFVIERYWRPDDPNAFDTREIQYRRVIRFKEFNLAPDYDVSKFRIEFAPGTLIYVLDGKGQIAHSYVQGSQPNNRGQ